MSKTIERGYSDLSPIAKVMHDLFNRNEDRYFSRQDLRTYTACGDNEMRQALHEVKCVMPIVNLQDGKGYKYTNNLEEIEIMYKQEMSRAQAILDVCHALKTRLEDPVLSEGVIAL